MPYQYYEENSKNKKIRVLVGFYIPVAYLIDEGEEVRVEEKGVYKWKLVEGLGLDLNAVGHQSNRSGPFGWTNENNNRLPKIIIIFFNYYYYYYYYY